MAKDRPSSDTMEINSILEETRQRNDRPDDGYVDITAPRTAQPRESYVDINAPTRRPASAAPEKNPPKKRKTGGIVALIIVGVVLLLGLGGLTWYLTSGSSTFAKNVSVNGISLAGMTVDEAKVALTAEEVRLADQIQIEVKAGDKSVTLTKEDLSYSFDTDDILSDARAYSEEKGLKQGERSYTITMTLDESSCEAASANVAEQVNTKPKNATVVDYQSSGSGTYSYQDEVKGLQLKEDELTEQLISLIQSGKYAGTINAPTKTLEPKYSKQYLKDHIHKLSSFTTTSTNNANGNNNMKVSLSACNNSIINPGETWSFNSCTGDSNLTENGYLPAGVIIEGRHETGIGGGICQSSTTIYNATVMCGMEVVERSCHYYKSAYVDAGRDATVDYGNLDLKMSNPFDYQLFMKCYMDGVTLHCEMYGVGNDEFDEITISAETTSTFSTGYKVAAYRTYYQNGDKVKTEPLPDSTYYTVEPGSSSSTSSKKKTTSSSGSSTTSSAGSSSSANDADSGSDDGGSADDGGAAVDDGGSSDDGGAVDDGGEVIDVDTGE